jgi:Tol biopolymer transport system component
MWRGNRLGASLAFVCLLVAACGRLQFRPTGGTAPPAFDTSSAIALSVLADSVYLIDPATGQTQTVANGLADFQSGYAAWSPDHHHLAWGDGGIAILDVTSGVKRRLNEGGSLSMPAWSPNGAQIAYGDGTGLWVTGVIRVRPIAISLPASLAPQSPSWTPGHAIAFDGLRMECGAGATCISTDSSEIWTVLPNGSGLKQVTKVGHAENPKWSPDGSQILFIRQFTKSKTQVSELWMVSAKGGDARPLLAAEDVVAAAWSENGQQIVFVRTGAGLNSLQVWVAGADGTGEHIVGQPVRGTDATIDW